MAPIEKEKDEEDETEQSTVDAEIESHGTHDEDEPHVPEESDDDASHRGTKSESKHSDANATDDESQDQAKMPDSLNSVQQLRKPQKRNAQHSYGVHRGFDFVGVRCVINYDMPQSEKAYIHRVGRTARAGSSGTALTLCASDAPQEVSLLEQMIASRPSTGCLSEMALKPLALDMNDIECFRYRVEDVLKSVTHKAIVTLRAQELQREVLRSARLKDHFQSNPNDIAALKNAFRSLEGKSPQQHLTHLKVLPSYLKPAVAALTCLTPVETAVMDLQKSETPNVSGTRRSRRSRDVLKNFSSTSSKRRRVHDLLQRNLAREPGDYSMTPVDSLPALSGRKLYNIQKGKHPSKNKTQSIDHRRRGAKRRALRPNL